MSHESEGVAARAHRTFKIKEYVRWSDVDISSVICWAAYTRFVEAAETEFFRAIGFPYATVFEELAIWLPRVQLHIDYRKPALLDEQLEIEVWVGRIRRSSIRLEFVLRKPGGVVAGEAHLVIVAMDRKSLRATGVPPRLLDALAPYRAEAAGDAGGSVPGADRG